jgi:hypothetical protein
MANSGGAGPTPGGSQALYGITTTTLVRGSRGVVFRVSVLVAGSAAGGVYNSSSTSSLTDQVFVIPSTVGIYEVLWPCANGIVIVPPTGGTVAVSYE